MIKWDARDYQKSSSEQQRWARELIVKLHLQGHESILDIGCGDGKVTAELAACVPDGSILGIDSSPDMIDLAKQAHSEVTNLKFQVGNASELSFENQFDIVFSNAALHWVVDHRPALSGIYQSLKRGGRILLQMGGKGNARHIINILDTLLNEETWHPYFTDFTFPYGFHSPDDYRTWMQNAGFNTTRVDLIPKDMVHTGKEGLCAWIRTTWMPYTQRVPENLRDTFINELADRYIAHRPPDSDENIHLDMVRLEVEAEKP